MLLNQLKIRNFRCFSEADLRLDANLNWVIGQNASGKSSLLEALFFLGHGRSFRSSRPDRLIRLDADGFELVARLEVDGREKVLGMARRNGQTEVRYAGAALNGMAEAARLLPVVILDSGMNSLVDGGPGERRRWLDWGVFHVEQTFLPWWREYHKALKQRNMALRSDVTERGLAPWTQALIRAGEPLSELRQAYIEKLKPRLLEYVSIALPEIELDVQYRTGWAEGETLPETLARHTVGDRERGNTRSGPHRADVQLRIDGLPAEERLSRGQQKMLAGALWLTQVTRFIEATGQKPLLLVDDLAAELDGDRLQRFLALLARQPAQQVLTAIADAEMARTGLINGKVFHVEHGVLTE